MHNILIICSYYPPSRAVGAIRPAKFAKYLPEFGWQPIILTVPIKHTATTVPVYTATAPTFEALYTMGRSLFPRKPADHFGETDRSGGEKSFTGRAESVNRWFFFPDKLAAWLPFAVSKGLEIAKTHSVQAILSTSPYETCHLVAKHLSQRLRCPWIADFRDPWLTNPFVKYPTGLHRKVHAALESGVIRSASRVVTVSKPIHRDFVERYPDQKRDKFAIIYNGYDSEDFVGLESQRNPQDNIVHIIHSGTFYEGRNPLTFLQALSLFDRPDLKGIEVTFLGEDTLPLRSAIKEFGLDETVVLKSHVPYRQSLQHLKDADIFLLLPGPGQGALTTKLFEYLRLGKFILALVPAGSAVIEVLKEAGTGLVVDHDSPGEIFRGLSHLIERIRLGDSPKLNWDFIERFDRRELTSQLAQILDELSKCSLHSAGV
jgi:glycosyltransferase involved in cell wall biosynthesis